MIITLNGRGSLTLPAELRNQLNLKPGDPLDIQIQQGQIILSPVAIVPRTWGLSPKGTKKEALADTDIKGGKIKTFTNAESLIQELNDQN